MKQWFARLYEALRKGRSGTGMNGSWVNTNSEGIRKVLLFERFLIVFRGSPQQIGTEAQMLGWSGRE